MNYFPIKVHSHYSLLRGLTRPEQLIDRMDTIGLDSCAITDFTSISGCVELFKQLKAAKKRCVLGCEILLSGGHTIIILCRNEKGWKRLLKIMAAANSVENYNVGIPTLPIEQLQGLASDHLICCLLPNCTEEIAKKLGGAFHHIFYLQLYTRPQLPDWSKNFTIVASPNSYYCEEKDAKDHQILRATAHKSSLAKIEDVEPQFFNTTDYLLTDFNQLEQRCSKQHIQNSFKVLELCEDYDILKSPILPPYKCPNNMSPNDYVVELCRTGYQRKLGLSKEHPLFDTYGDRIRKEMAVLTDANLSSYFLTVKDICDFVRNEGALIGPGRGSAAGSLVSYLLDITDIDPIKHDLIFERFYNAGRNTEDHISYPDIDIDIPKEYREKVLSYINTKYGNDKVGQIMTYQTMMGRSALKAVFRAYDKLSFAEQNRITKYIPDKAAISGELQNMKEALGFSSVILWALENYSSKLKQWCSYDGENFDGPLATEFQQAIRLESTKSNKSRHAAGLAIGTESLQNICPMIMDEEHKQLMIGVEMDNAEDVGLVKLDILGLNMLDKAMEVTERLKGDEEWIM